MRYLMTVMATLMAVQSVAQINARKIESRSIGTRGAKQRSGREITQAERSTQRVVVMNAAVKLDSNMITSDLNNAPDVESMQWWALKYASCEGQIKSVAWPWLEPVRAIAEVRAPHSKSARKNQRSEVRAAQDAGYDAVFAVWRGENPKKLADEMEWCQSKNMRVILAYGPGESYKPEIYGDSETMQENLSALVEHADAFYPCWRWVSAGHWTDTSYAVKHAVTLSEMARETKPDLPVISEAFLDARHQTLEIVHIEGASAYMLVNAGYRGIIPQSWARKVRERVGEDTPLLALIIGARPYYASWNNKRGAEQDEYQIKRRLENRFAAEGFDAGTITLAGDGSDTRTQSGKWKPVADGLTHSRGRGKGLKKLKQQQQQKNKERRK